MEGSGKIPEFKRRTAWEFLGQQIPKPYARLIFGTLMNREMYSREAIAYDEKERSTSAEESKEHSTSAGTKTKRA